MTPRAVALAVVLIAGAGCGPSGARDGGPVRLTLLGTTDVHGHLLPYDYATDTPRDGSLAQVATLVDSIRRTDPHTLLFDSGDLLQGTPLDEYSARVAHDSIHPVIAAMNSLRYDAAAIGNHEFNYGVPFLDRSLRAARFPFLAANIYREGVDSLAYRPYVLLDAGDVRIGVLGFTTPGVRIWDRANISGRLRFEDIVASARRWVPKLREAGADIVVVLAHSGLGPGSSYSETTGVPEENAVSRLAREVPGIDVIFAGHSHTAIPGRRIGGALILQAYRFAARLAVAHLTVRFEGSTARVVEDRGELLTVDAVSASPEIERVAADAHRRTLAWLREPIATTPDHWSAASGRIEDTPIVDLIEEVERAVSGADLASASVFRPAASFGPGAITRRDILGLYVYPNTLKAVRISGRDLRAYLERSAAYYRDYPAARLVDDSVPGYNFDTVSGVDYTLDLRRPRGERVADLRYRGRPVAPADSFVLAVNNYRQSGGGGFQMIADAPVVFSTETPVSQLLIDYIRRRDTLRATDVFRRNWRILPAAAVRQLKHEAAAATAH
ncbi:MAG: bifunctional metallophosphatase/5'-nucleotidase [Gemmatimonadota bacterium]